MNTVVKYSFRIFALTAALFSAGTFGNLPYPLYLDIMFCFLPWMVYELFFVEFGEKRILSVLVLESISVISSLILLNPYLFSIFLSMLFLQISITYSGKKGFILNISVSIIFAAALYLTKETAAILIVVVPSGLISGMIIRAMKEHELELTAEIDAQQKQIDGKNKLLSTLSHELRTPLAVIKTSSEILLEERPGNVNPTQQRFLKAIQDNSIRMSRFIDSILASIKVEYAWFRMKKKEKDIRTVIKKVCNDLGPFIQSRNQTIKYTYPNLLSKTVIDENWIQQVLINLIHNASKHVEKNGRILVSVNENEQCVVVSVSDDGSGIINEDKPKVFSEFYQGKEQDGAVEEAFDGVGLGLSIVKNVIEKHGGNVYMGSVSGMGTTISFTIPKAEA